MNDANVWPDYPADKFLRKNQDLLEAQLLYAGIHLEVFSYLTHAASAQELAKRLSCHAGNMELFLNALTAAEYLKKEHNTYINLPETELYLNKNSSLYLGDYLLYWKEATSLEELEKRVREGPEKAEQYKKNGSNAYDFRKMGLAAKNEMYTGRVQTFLEAVRRYFKENQSFSSLDLGCGSGIFSIELARNFPKAQVTAMDQPQVTKLTEEICREYGVEHRVKILEGDFTQNSLGKGYDLVIASGIFDFVGDVKEMAKRIYEAMNPEGILYLDTHKVNDAKTAPKPCILGWLSTHLNGLNILQTDRQIVDAVGQAGFASCTPAGKHAFTGYIFRKPAVSRKGAGRAKYGDGNAK